MSRRRPSPSCGQLALPIVDPSDLPERLASRITIDCTTGCWLWTAARNGKGYGMTRSDGVLVYVHRLIWHLLVDPELPVSPGRGAPGQMDHRCRVRACVNPAHLEVVSNRENVIRGRVGVLGSHASRFVGVNRNGRVWRAELKVDGHRVALGCFLTEHAAAVMYDAASVIAYSDATNHRLGLLAELPTATAIDDARRRLDRAATRGRSAS